MQSLDILDMNIRLSRVNCQCVQTQSVCILPHCR